MFYHLTALDARHQIVDQIETQIIDEDTRDLALSFLRGRSDELFAFPTLEEEAYGIAWAMALIATLEPDEFPEQDSSSRLAILDALGRAFASCQAQRALRSHKRASVN